MKRRIVRPYAVLAVALIPACKPDGTAKPEPVPTAPSAVASAAAPTASAAPDPALLALATELSMTAKKDALARKAHFRPLCDDKGYPLVGNVMAKGPAPADNYLPSAFCADVRTSGSK